MLTREHPWIAKYWLCHFCHGLNGGYLGFFDPQWKINRNLQVFKRFPQKKKRQSRKTKKMEKTDWKKALKLRKKSVQIGNYRSNPIAYKKRTRSKAFKKRSKSVRKPFETVRHYAKFYVKWKTFQDPNHAVPKVTWTTLGKRDSKHWPFSDLLSAVDVLEKILPQCAASLLVFSAMQHSLVTCLETHIGY